MGIISLEKQDHLYWLGRYSERVYTTLKTFLLGYDQMLDDEGTTYGDVCRRLDIPNIYTSQENFIKIYLFSDRDANSVYSNLKRAYDNAVVLRDEISSPSLCYIQMALDIMEACSGEPLNLLELQRVLDTLLAFWGSVDDNVLSEESRNIMKSGRYLERLDLFIRFGYPAASLARELGKFENRIRRLQEFQYDGGAYQAFEAAVRRGGSLKPQLVNLNQIILRRPS